MLPPIGVIVTDSNGVVVKVNSNVLEVYGIDKQDFIGAPVCDVLPRTGKVIQKSLRSRGKYKGNTGKG